nr:APH(3'') family aminoglycoside O-phosphotransferase [Rhizobium sp. P28RR-XV]NLR89490.1 APH(3'') family aminoglycoside O-phosphotransferase [Rhizobium sp. P28RR-XV]
MALPIIGIVEALLAKASRDWTQVKTGESGDLVYRREDGRAYAKMAAPARSADLAGERDRLLWLQGKGIAVPEVIDWREVEEGACLVISAIPGVPAVDLDGDTLLKAWPSMARQLKSLHELPTDQCTFDRSLSLMFAKAADVVSRHAVNRDFLRPEDWGKPAGELLDRVERDLPVRIAQETADKVLCHGDACMPNFMVDPHSLQCIGLIDLGRAGKADRCVDLALMIANAEESWAKPEQGQKALSILFETLEIAKPDRERLAFYLRLDPLTWADSRGGE